MGLARQVRRGGAWWRAAPFAMAAALTATVGWVVGSTSLLLGAPGILLVLAATWGPARSQRLASAAVTATLLVAAFAAATTGPGWRELLGWAVTAPVVGHVLAGRRREHDLATERAVVAARALEVAETNLAAVGRVAHAVTSDMDDRRRVCEAACEVSGAAAAVLLEPDHLGNLVSTAIVGADVPRVRIALTEPRAGAVEAFTTGRRVVRDDTVRDQDMTRRVALATGTSAMRFEPVPGPDGPLGVLAIAWTGDVHRLSPAATTVVDLLAAEAAGAIRRADLVTELEGMARTDALTGLPNRRAWEELLDRELAYARRTGHPLALALLDLDRFKTYNDTRGHQAGDRLLKMAAAAWRTQLREVDVLARWGGEEFVVLLPSCGLADAHSLIERLRRATPDGQTCSAGITVWDGSETLGTMLERADRALYAAKDSGRDRAVSTV